MQNEKDFFYHYNEFLQNLDFETVFQKIVYELLVFVLYKIVYFFLTDYY